MLYACKHKEFASMQTCKNQDRRGFTAPLLQYIAACQHAAQDVGSFEAGTVEDVD